jgi:tetratricopeptide (TPR) repeat protein
MHRAAAVLVGLLWTGTLAAQQAPTPATPEQVRVEYAERIVRGDAAWDREDFPAAFVAYDAVVRADSTFNTRALYRVGLLHSWADRFGPATAALRLYVKVEQDNDGRLALARTYAWAARYRESLAQYDTVLEELPDRRDAVIGRATALAWAGRLLEAEAALSPWITAHPTDADALISLGQFRQWRGAAWAADEAYRKALLVAPPNSATTAQLTKLRDALRADLRPSAMSRVVSALDSEENGLTDLEVQGSVLSQREMRFTAVARLREATDALNRSVTVPGVHGIAQWTHPRTQVSLRAEVGVVSFPAGVADAALQGRGALRASGRLGSRLRMSAGVAREPFDDVVSMARRALMFSLGDVDLAYAVHPKVSLGLATSVGEVGGAGFTGQRLVGLGAVRWTPRAGATFALQHREASWDKPAFGVFFAPQRWTTTEVNASWERQAEVGFQLGSELALGSQGIRFEGASSLSRSLAPRAAIRAGWRVAPGREILAGLLYANVAGAGAVTASEYRYGAFTLTGRWTF